MRTPTMGELVQFLRDRLNEEAALAEAASPGPWHPGEEFDEVVAVDGITVAEGFALSGRQLRATVDHIARHDPARVLTEVAFKRLLLGRWTELQARIDAEQGREKRDRLALTRHGLDMFVYQLGTVYANHPGCRQEWRP